MPPTPAPALPLCGRRGSGRMMGVLTLVVLAVSVESVDRLLLLRLGPVGVAKLLLLPPPLLSHPP